MTDDQIVQELEKMEFVSACYIRRKYHVNHRKAIELQNRWVDNEPSGITFDQLLSIYNERRVKK